MNKEILRQNFLKIRKSIDQKERVMAAKAAALNFFKEIDLKQVGMLAGYHPISTEISDLPILEEAGHRGFKTCLPVIERKDYPLIFKVWSSGEVLEVSNIFSIEEPVYEAKQVVPDLLIVPIVAFDNTGHRLGFGKGYYDRTIEKFRQQGHKFIAVGLAFECQLAPSIPAELSDKALDFIVTEEMVRKF